MSYKTLLVAIAVAIPMLITGCSGNPNGNQIEITTPPPASMEVNLSASIAAIATGNLKSAGVATIQPESNLSVGKRRNV